MLNFRYKIRPHEWIYKLIFSQTARDTYLIFGSNIFTAFIAFIYTIFLARKFTPEDFGIFQALITFLILFSDIADLGIGSSLSRFIPPLISKKRTREESSILKNAFLFQMKITILLGLLIVILSPILSRLLLRTSVYQSDYMMIGVGLIGFILLNFSLFTLSAKRRFIQVAVLNVFSTVIKLVLIIGLFSFNTLTLTTALLAFIASAYIGYILSLKFLKFSFLREKENKKELRKILAYSLYLGVARLMSATANKLDVIMMVPLASAYEAGIYSAAFKISSIYIMFIGSLGMVTAPRFSSFMDKKSANAYMRKVFLLCFILIISMMAMGVFAPFIVPFVLGNKYIESIPVFQLLMLPMALFTLSVPLNSLVLYYFKKPYVSTINTSGQLLIIVLGNYILLPTFGRFAPVITLTAAYLYTLTVYSGFTYLFSKKYAEK